MKTKNYILAITTLLCCSCTTDSVSITEGDVVDYLYFDVAVAGKSTTTKTEIVSPNNLEIFTKFGIYAVEGVDSFFDDKKVILDPNNDTWHTTSQVASWPESGALVYGYAPYDNTSVVSSVDEHGHLVLDYIHATTFDDQVDLMVAEPITANSIDNIAINFNHALSAIAFNCKGYGSVRVKKLGFKGCYNRGQLTTDSSGVSQWSDCVADGVNTYQMTLYDNNIPTEKNSVLSSANGEYLMMMPSDDLSNVQFIALLSDLESGDESVISLSIPTSEVWEANNIYTYNITVDELSQISFSDDITVSSWTQSEDNNNQYSATQQSAASEVANCYMLNSTLDDKVFYIPVDERIKEFWGGYEGYTGEDYDNYTLNFGDEWSASYIWYAGDFTSENITEFSIETLNSGAKIDAVGRNEKVSAATCTNNFITQRCRAAMKITIPGSIAEGNILVGVYKTIDGSKKLLWSWHLWVTAYNPNTATPTSVNGSELNFSVDGGNVQRYCDAAGQKPAIWGKGGLYDGKYIMDRNIGAYSNNRIYGTTGDVLYYQFGRKDPLPVYTSGTNTTIYYAPEVTYASGYDTYTTSTSGVSMATSVANPTRRYYYNSTSKSWCIDDVVKNLNCLWNDESVDNDIYADFTQKQKSMFDPSPLGWKIPVDEAWNNFPTSLTMSDWSNSDTSADYYFNTVNRSTDANGLQFMIYGYIPFSSSGYLPYSYSYAYQGSSYGFYYNTYSTSYYYYSYLWSASPSTTYYAKCHYWKFYGYNLGSGTTVGYGGNSSLPRQSAMSIRCIQE